MTGEPKSLRIVGIWHCWLPGTNFHRYCGLGYTPDAAYEDWMRLIAKMEKA